jgi:peptidyl-dipeptidase A
MKYLITLTLFIVVLASCQQPAPSADEANMADSAQAFIDNYTTEFQRLYEISANAEWASNTEIIEGDTTNAVATRKANEDYANFTGSEVNIKQARKYLEYRDQLDDITVRQLEGILYAAANNPATVPDLVKARIKAETEQNQNLFGFNYVVDGDTVSTNQIDGMLADENDVAKRQAAWEASKEVGRGLKSGLENLRNLRNQTVQALGYDDYFSYQVSDYGMSSEEMSTLMNQLVKEIWPLYKELHTYARYTLAEKYGQPVPDMLPAHWLPNRWGQGWESMVTVEGLDLEEVFNSKTPEWIVEQGERFYVSMGFPEMPKTFWTKSSLYPLPEDAGYKKNNHASAWHMDLDQDVRSLMSVETNQRWYETSHHELGHIYYYMTYTNEDVPVLLRGGANRGYHEAMGSLLGLAAMQRPFMEGLGLIDSTMEVSEEQEIQTLLMESLNYIVFMPWGAGVMTEFEHDLYANDIPVDEFNARWWELKEKYQGIVPPTDRGEEFCDAASKTHINNDPAQYYDYAISFVLLFQFHDHIAKNILNQDPHATNYYGNKEVGKFLHKVMYPGATRDWRELLKETTGEEMSARAMLEYFEPLMAYLQEVNAGRTHTLPNLGE